MNNISPLSLPNLNGFSSEDLDTFLFEFYVLFKIYDYTTNVQKLKLLLATLKNATLHWFMGLGGKIIRTWDTMKQTFLNKYQDYCKAIYLHEEISKMT